MPFYPLHWGSQQSPEVQDRGFGLGIIGFLLRLAGPLLVFIALVTLAVLMWNPSSQISSIPP